VLVVVRLGVLLRQWLLPADRGTARGCIEMRERDRRLPVSGIVLVLVCMRARGEVDKVKLDMLLGLLGDDAVNWGGANSERVLCIRRKYAGPKGRIGFGGLGMVLGGR
jgi:hypothetical protein